jgi:colanic acid/amylovoran biosynthesis glycosyltransferase
VTAFRYLLRYYPTLTETFVYNEIRGLQARGCEVSGLAIGSRSDGALASALPDWEVRHPPGYQAVAAAAARVVAGAGGRAAAAWLSQHQPAKQVARAMWAASTLREGERLHAHFAGEAAEWALAAGMARGNPFGVTVHAVDLFCPRPSLPEVLRRAAVVLTISEHNAGVIRERYGVEASVVRCGIDPASWGPSQPAEPGPVVAVGRWVPKKGFDLLVEAVRRVPGARLQLIGDAPPEAAGQGVEVLGPLSAEAIAAALRGACLFALPCREDEAGNRDGIPVAMMEAMASGLPVLTTTLPGLGELVDDACGWRVPPEDVPALARALEEALADPEGRARRGAAARERVLAGFTLDAQVEGLLAAWRGA